MKVLSLTSVHRVLALVFTAALAVRPGTIYANDIREGADMPAPGAAGGVEHAGAEAMDIGRGRPMGGGISAPVMAGAMNVAAATGILGQTNRVNNADGSVSFNSRETGQPLVSIQSNGQGGATVTLHQNAEGIQPNFGVNMGGNITQTPLNMIQGSLTMNVTPQSARIGLAESATASGPLVMSNSAALSNLSPGNRASVVNAVTMNPGAASFTMTAASFHGQNVVNYAATGSPAAATMMADAGARSTPHGFSTGGGTAPIPVTPGTPPTTGVHPSDAPHGMDNMANLNHIIRQAITSSGGSTSQPAPVGVDPNLLRATGAH